MSNDKYHNYFCHKIVVLLTYVLSLLFLGVVHNMSEYISLLLWRCDLSIEHTLLLSLEVWAGIGNLSILLLPISGCGLGNPQVK